MTYDDLATVLSSATAMGFLVAGLFFLRFWRDTSDRLFALFAGAMWILSLNWAILAALHPGEESRHYVYMIRLVAFVLIIAAVVDKNRADRGT
jgi:zinc transporter ZupT